MRISIVIASFNRRDSLARCLATLNEQDLAPTEYEVVVVVDGSTDGTAEMLNLQEARMNLVVVEQSNRGQAAARNAGVNAANGEIALFIDDDLLCDRRILPTHLAAHEAGNPRLVCGRIQSVLSPAPSLAERSMHFELERYYSRLAEGTRLKWPDHAWVGPNCSCERSAFLAVGGFDDREFPRRWEDVDLGLRLWKSGVPFIYEPRAIAWHYSVKADGQSRADIEEDGASVVKLCKRHPEMRSATGLSAMMNASLWKRFAARVASGSTIIAKVISRGLGATAGTLAKVSWGNRLGTRLFGLEQSLVLLAGARREAGSWAHLARFFNQRIVVLLYHHVGAPNDQTSKSSLTVSPSKFRRQVGWLRWRGYHAITPSQLLDWRTAGSLLPKKPLLITFDDGYADIQKYAFPVLEANGFCAVVFIITKLAEDLSAWESMPLMTMEEIKHWASRGMEFGGHTRTHPDLTKISVDCCDEEIGGSKQDLSRAGLTPVSFAYPFGSFNEQARKSAGGFFPLAFTCEEGMNDLSTDPLLLKRTMVNPGDTLLDLELRAAFGRSPLDFMRSRLRIRSRVSNLWRQLLVRS